MSAPFRAFAERLVISEPFSLNRGPAFGTLIRQYELNKFSHTLFPACDMILL